MTLVNDANKNIQVSLNMTGYFSYKGTDKTQLIKYLGFNAPAIMFPYVRAYVSNLTGLSGISPIVMPTINMEPVGKALVKQLEEQLK